MDKTLIAPCGMNCSLCMAYQRIKNKCHGCWGEEIFKMKSCARCVIKNCDLLDKTTSKFCFECPSYPCKRLTHLDKRYRTKYRMSMINNLEYIKVNGVDAFIALEKIKWQCPQCGGFVSVHREYCLNCKMTVH